MRSTSRAPRISRRLAAAMAVLCGLGLAPAAQAQERYPSKPIRIIVPFVAGGIGDTIARTLAPVVGDSLGQSVIVENRPGGDSLTGTEYAMKSAPDGYTVMQVSTPQSINMVLRANAPYDLLRDFRPVARVVHSSLVLVAPAHAPFKNVAEMVAHGKAKSGGLSFGSGGIGSVGHLSGELLKRATGMQALHVPYKGNAAVIPDLIGGRLDFFFASQPEAVQGSAAGHLRVLAVTSVQRAPTFPDTPTMIEAGFPGFDPSSNYGYLVPLATPAPIVQQLRDAFAKAMQSPAVLERFRTLGLTPNFGGPEELTATLRGEITRWGQVVRTASIKAE